MLPPISSLLTGNAGVQSVFGTPPRVWPFAEAPQNSVKPYATWQVVSGQPENQLDGAPGMDDWVVQFDVWAASVASAIAGATALRDALETKGHITRYGETSREPDTLLYRYSFDFEIWVRR